MTLPKRILVAGGGLGIGQHNKEVLINHHNVKVVVFSLDVYDTVKQWEKEDRVLVIKGGATKPESLEKARIKAEEHLGGLDYLVITLGVIGQIERVDVLDIKAMRRTFEINVFAPLQLTLNFLPLLRSSKGSVVALSSAADREICRVDGLLIHAEESVQVPGVYPGLTRTPMVTDLLAVKFMGIMKDWEAEEFKRRDRDGEVEPPEWSANTTAKLAAGALPFPSQGKVLWYNELDPNYKEQK